MSKGLEALKDLKEQFELLGIKSNPYLKIIEKELKDYEELKTYMQQYGTENIEETRRVLHNVWVSRQTFKTDITNVIKALEIIKENDVDVTALKISINLKQYNCKEDGRCPLTQEEYNLLKETML